MANGPFDITVDGQLLMPEVPLTQTASHQNVSIDWVNNHFYSTQVIKSGVLLPGEVAPALTQAQRGLAGDIAVTRFDEFGTITGVMYLRGVGHGTSLTAEPVGADTYLWVEADAQPDGTLSYGTKVGRVQFIDGSTVDSSSPAVEKFDPVPGFRRVLSTVDFQNDRICVSRADLTSARLRTYFIYNLTDFRLGIYTLIVTFPRDASVGPSLQNALLYDEYLYEIQGSAYSGTNPPPGDSYINVYDTNSGMLIERRFNNTALFLTNREPEGVCIDWRGVNPRLVYSFSTNAPAPIRWITLYVYDLYAVTPPGPVQYWTYTTGSVEEAPFAWNALHERFRIPRGISVQEVAPGLYQEVRYAAYTDELGSENLPRDTAYQSQEFYKDLNFFRGGYEHIVDDNVKSALINSGVAQPSQFVLIP